MRKSRPPSNVTLTKAASSSRRKAAATSELHLDHLAVSAPSEGHHECAPLDSHPTHNLFLSFPFLCSGSGASMAKLAGERRSRPTFEIRLSMGYIHGQAPTAKKFTHHHIRRRSKRKIPPQARLARRPQFFLFFLLICIGDRRGKARPLPKTSSGFLN